MVTWSPSPPNRYKINVDGAVFKDQRVAGVGVLVRDAEGTLIVACSKWIMAPLGAIEVEAKAFAIWSSIRKGPIHPGVYSGK